MAGPFLVCDGHAKASAAQIRAIGKSVIGTHASGVLGGKSRPGASTLRAGALAGCELGHPTTHSGLPLRLSVGATEHRGGRSPMMEEQGYDAILVAIGTRDQLTKEAA